VKKDETIFWLIGAGYAVAGLRKILLSSATVIYMTTIMLNTAVPVRFTDAQDRRLRAISDRTGISVAALIRNATDEFLDRIEAAGEVAISLGKRAAKYPQRAQATAALNEKHAGGAKK
jgi:hypothetical protein